MAKPLQRTDIYQSTYQQVIQWAYLEYARNGARTPAGKPIYKSFPYALEQYLNTLI